MAKKKNRNLQFFPLERLNRNRDSFHVIDERFFKEQVNEGGTLSFSEESDSLGSLDIILNGIRDLGSSEANNGKSSSSSLSWGENCKTEASQQIHDELDKIHRVLNRLDSIPPNYDENEFKEWMQFFPNISIWGKSDSKPITPQFSSPKDSELRSRVATKLSDTIFENVAKRLIKDKTASNNNLSLESKLSNGSSNADSSKSLFSSQMLSLKWLKEEDEYNSLPFLTRTRDKDLFLKRDQLKQLRPRSILKSNNLILPPIENSTFRSISATPRTFHFVDRDRLSSISFLSSDREVRRRFNRNERGNNN